MTTKVDFDAGAAEKNFFRSFTRWLPWQSRDEEKDQWGYHVHEYPGVYLLAHFDGDAPKGVADYTDPAIIYVGEALWLQRRWRQFIESACYGRSGHSGGHSYRAKYKTKLWSKLYVAALPIWFGKDTRRSLEDWTQAFRHYVERRVIWEITMSRGGTNGLLNRK